MEGIIISIKEDVQELLLLAKSLGYKIKKIFVQKREGTTPCYIGEGKLKEIKEYVCENNISIAFVNDSLRPSQWYNLEKNLGIIVYDRIRLILEIFASRAKRREAKLQVQLAKLRYERPFVRELFHRIKEGERPGFLGGGEYVVADYYEMMKRQMKKIKEELRKIEEERALKRMARKERGFYLVSIAGYTNAGKSSLLNFLTDANVVVEEKLFSTLSTKTMRINRKDNIPILLTDTVGFIKDLPHWLIDAFHSTLEEIALADAIILLADITDDVETLKDKIFTALKEIYHIKRDTNIVVALNKIDLINDNEVDKKRRILEEILERRCIPISAKTGENMESLLNELYKNLPKISHLEIVLPNDANSFISWLYENTNVIDFSSNGFTRIRVDCSERLREKIMGKCRKLGGEVRVLEC